MKHKSFKFCLLFSSIWMMSFPLSIVAQPNNQYEITGLSTKGSIIVAYTDDIDIIYNDDGTKSFLQVDRSNLTVDEAKYITTSCANTTSLTLDGTVHDVYDWDMDVKTDFSKGLPDYYPATLNNYPLTKICDD